MSNEPKPTPTVEQILDAYHSASPGAADDYARLLERILQPKVAVLFAGRRERATPTWSPSVVQQEVLLSVLRYVLPPDVRTQPSFVAWLSAVLRKRLADHGRRVRLRKTVDHVSLQESATEDITDPGKRDLRDMVEWVEMLGLMDVLSGEQRHAIEVRFFRGLSTPQFAASHNLDAKSAEALIRSAMARLRRAREARERPERGENEEHERERES